MSGTGTGVGKTHVSDALLRCWARGATVCGLKPIETGIAPGAEGDDFLRLRSASTFHVKQRPPYAFAPPVSPHLAAAEAGETILASVVEAYVADVRRQASGVLVELPGGLFTPLARRLTNADLAAVLEATSILLVAPNRLGVLHDVAAATRAAKAAGLRIDGIVLSAPFADDASTPSNANELASVTDVPLLCAVGRASAEALSTSAGIHHALARLIGSSSS